MNPTLYPIAAGDFEQAGAASRRLKEQLKQIGAAPDAVRRAMIAAYEAEMNVVIHSRGGRLEARLGPDRLDVEVADDGPGIADVDLAMREGYSTAPPAARALGFGAGMGLPNIRAASDVFTVESAAGRGTRVRFTVYLKPQEGAVRGRNSIRVVADRCHECLRCLHACPTRALRVRSGRPIILEHLCVDCTSCLAACPTGALAIAAVADALPPADDAVLVMPAAALFQFGPGVTPARVLAALADLGFRDVRLAEVWEHALREAVLAYARSGEAAGPVLSPACPAVANLVATRFPSLLGQMAPWVSPMEAAREELRGRRAVFVAACPAQRTVLDSVSTKPEILVPATLVAAVMPRVAGAKMGTGSFSGCLEKVPVPVFAGGPTGTVPFSERPEKGTVPRRGTQVLEGQTGILRATGMAHVVRVLEELENGRLGDVAVLDLWACDEGCSGSPLFGEDAFVACHRAAQAGAAVGRAAAGQAGAVRRQTPLAARAGVRLDADMAKAIQKLAAIEQRRRTLAGCDCGRCGAPACAAMAEDIVLGRAADGRCARRPEGQANLP